MVGGEAYDTFDAGTLAGAGTFRCYECGFAVALHERDEVPTCPHCGGDQFKRSSIFGALNPVQEPESALEEGRPAWLAEARDAIERPGAYLAFDDDGLRIVELTSGWTRIGRSLSADVRFDDPTVSRRHALLHRDEHGARILDDRSLNGVFVNGERVDMRELEDGDELTVGRFHLHFVTLSGEAVGGRSHSRGAFA